MQEQCGSRLRLCLESAQGRLWWLLAGAGYGLGEWAMGHIVEPDSAREQRIWEGIQGALKDEPAPRQEEEA